MHGDTVRFLAAVSRASCEAPAPKFATSFEEAYRSDRREPDVQVSLADTGDKQGRGKQRLAIVQLRNKLQVIALAEVELNRATTGGLSSIHKKISSCLEIIHFDFELPRKEFDFDYIFDTFWRVPGFHTSITITSHVRSLKC